MQRLWRRNELYVLTDRTPERSCYQRITQAGVAGSAGPGRESWGQLKKEQMRIDKRQPLASHPPFPSALAIQLPFPSALAIQLPFDCLDCPMMLRTIPCTLL